MWTWPQHAFGKGVAALAALCSLAGSSVAPATPAAPLAYKTIPGASPVVREDRPIEASELETFIDGAMASEFAGRKLAGAAIVVVKDGEVLFHKGYGYSDLESRIPVDPATTQFTVGSVSKLFTWTAAMQLAERGQLDLDADINRYLTKFKIPATFSTPITMRNLLTHTAGFEDKGTPFAPVIHRRYGSLGDFLAAHLPKRVLPPVRDFAHAARPYSNWGALLAGHVVECAAGEDFNSYVARNLLGPLGMTNSRFQTRQPPPRDRQATGYMFANGAMQGRLEDMSPSGPAGAMVSTVDDIAKFMIAHLEGGAYGGNRILAPKTVALMHRRSAQSSPYLDGVALGFIEAHLNGRRVLRHDGSTATTQSEIMLMPEKRLGLFVTFNSIEGGYARQDLRNAFINRYFPADLPRVAPPADFASRAAEYAGNYRSLRRSYTSYEKLFGGFPLTVSPLPNGKLLIAGSQWTEVAPDTFRSDAGDMLGFHRNADNQVVSFSMKTSLLPAERVSSFETPMFHALLALLALIAGITSIVIAIRQLWARKAASIMLVRIQRLTALIGVINIVTFVLLASVFAGGVAPLMTDGLPQRLHVGLSLAIASVILSIAALPLVILMFRRGKCSRGAGMVQLASVLLSLMLGGLLHHWNLLGYHFG